MATFRVRGPDGSIHQVTAPDNATPAQVQAYVQHQLNQPTTLDHLHGAATAFLDGALPGAGGVVSGIANAALHPSHPLDSFSSGRQAAERHEEGFKQAHPYLGAAATAAGFVGGLALPTSELGLAGRGAQAALKGRLLNGAANGAILGGAGGLLSSHANSALGAVADAAKGAVTGGIAGGAIPVASRLAAPITSPIANGLNRTVVAPAIARLAKLAPPSLSRGLQNRASALGGDPAEKHASRYIGNVIAGAGHDPASVITDIQRRQALGVPAVPADISEHLRDAYGSAARRPGPITTAVRRTIDARQAEQTARAQQHIADTLGPTANVDQQARALGQQAREQANPLFDIAYAGGSQAPLEHHFTQAFQHSSAAVSDAQRALQEAQHGLTFAKTRTAPHQGENVYWASQANAGERAAHANVAQAQDALAAAQAHHESIRSRLQQAQADGSADAPGATWSPRIQQFLDDPIAQEGLSKGLSVQRLESLADGKAFNPREYAITGTDHAGNPVVSAVPNTRNLHAVKLGFDDIINGYDRAPNGAPILDQYGRAVDKVRKSFLQEVDRINPAYREARQAWAGPIQDQNALKLGKGLATTSAEDIANRTEDFSDSELAHFRLGHRSGLAENVAGLGDYGNAAGFLEGSLKKRGAIAQAHGDDAAQALADRLEAEKEAYLTYATVRGNSHTAGRQVADEIAEQEQSLADAGKGLWAAGQGRFLDAARHFGNAYGGNYAAGKAVNEKVAGTLGSQDINHVRQALGDVRRVRVADKAAQQRTLTRHQVSAKLFGSRTGAGVSTPADQALLGYGQNDDGSNYPVYGTPGTQLGADYIPPDP